MVWCGEPLEKFYFSHLGSHFSSNYIISEPSKVPWQQGGVNAGFLTEDHVQEPPICIPGLAVSGKGSFPLVRSQVGCQGQEQPIRKRDHGELAWREGIEQIAGWKGGVGEAGT